MAYGRKAEIIDDVFLRSEKMIEMDQLFYYIVLNVRMTIFPKNYFEKCISK